MKVHRLSLPFAAVLLFCFAPSLHAADSQPPKLRLPADVAPVRYAAELWLDPAK